MKPLLILQGRFEMRAGRGGGKRNAWKKKNPKPETKRDEKRARPTGRGDGGVASSATAWRPPRRRRRRGCQLWRPGRPGGLRSCRAAGGHRARRRRKQQQRRALGEGCLDGAHRRPQQEVRLHAAPSPGALSAVCRKCLLHHSLVHHQWTGPMDRLSIRYCTRAILEFVRGKRLICNTDLAATFGD